MKELIVSTSSPQAKEIIFDALDLVAKRYSETGNQYEDRRAELYFPYHNRLHSSTVVSAAEELSELVGLTPSEHNVALCAAAAHDIFHDLGMEYGQNEELSAEWLAERMNRIGGFSKVSIKAGELAILGTKTRLLKRGGGGANYQLLQSFNEISYPSKRSALIAEVVASADLSQLLSRNGPLLSHKMYEENTMGASGLTPRINQALIDFLEIQASLVSSFEFSNNDINHHLSRGRNEVLVYSANLLDDVKSGCVTSWKQVLERDIEFMNKQKH